MNLYDMQSWVQDHFPGKWENSFKTDWLTNSPFRQDKHPSFSINLEKRVAYDRATAETFLLSEVCQRLGIDEPCHEKESLSPRIEQPTINSNALIASSRWKKAQPARDDFPYLLRKGIPSLGLRTDLDSMMGEVILVPAYDASGQLVGLERITQAGEKRHLGEKKNAYFLIGEPRPGEQVFICEGYATACSVHEITAQAVAVSFSLFNLPNVADTLKGKGFLPTICTDAGAPEVAGFRNISMPEGTPAKQDWNDLHRQHGLNRARELFQEAERNSTEVDKPNDRSSFKIKKMNARELYQTFLAPQTWAIDQMIPQGLTVLASPPKTGKSYFVLQAAFAVARGEKFLGYRTTKGKVLLLSLEDTFNRLQKRIVQVCPDTSRIPDNLDMTVEFPRLDSEGLACLDKEIKESGYSLVIADTWGKTKPNGQAKRSENVYETDVRLVSEVKKLADKYGISILLVHHLKKGGGASKDWLESLSGSMGLSATVDGLLALERDRGADVGILKRSGRDLEDDEDIGLNWLAPCWEFNGSAVQMKLNSTKRKILDCLEQAREPMTPSLIATDAGLNANTVRWHLMKMVQDGVVTLTTNGQYMPSPKKEIQEENDGDFTNTANSTNTTNSTNSANSTNVGDFKEVTNSKTNSSLVSSTNDLKPPVGSVGTVGKSGNSLFCGKEYSEVEAQSWLDSEALEEARELYLKKFDNLHKTMSEQASRDLALRRTWEHFNTARQGYTPSKSLQVTTPRPADRTSARNRRIDPGGGKKRGFLIVPANL
jgi:hypothetical protein